VIKQSGQVADIDIAGAIRLEARDQHPPSPVRQAHGYGGQVERSRLSTSLWLPPSLKLCPAGLMARSPNKISEQVLLMPLMPGKLLHRIRHQIILSQPQTPSLHHRHFAMKATSTIFAIYPPVVSSKSGSMKPSGSIPVPARTDDLPLEIIRKRPSLQGATLEKPGGLEQARHLAQETKVAKSISDKKSAAPEAPTQGIKNSWPPDFDDDAIKWVGRTI
jgi:hypothetical protein